MIPCHLKTKEISKKAVRMGPYSLEVVPDHLKTQEMCSEAVRVEPYTPEYVPDHLKTKGMKTGHFFSYSRPLKGSRDVH